MGHFLGIDLGGTNIVAGVVDENHQILHKSHRPTLAKRSFEAIVADMAAAAREALADAGLGPDAIPYVGIGVPSTVDPVTHRLAFANNLSWRDVDVVAEFQKTWNIPIRIGNDADCAALGECLAGAGQAYGDILMITLGTGVGGGIVLDKKIFLGGGGYGVEPGHTLLVHDGFLCTCGQRGCLEAYASVVALIRQSIDMMMVYPDSLMWEKCGHDLNKVEGRTPFEAARQGDLAGKMVIDQYVRHLAGGLASMVNLLRPQAIILGGGVSNAGEFLLEPLRREVAQRVYSGDTLLPPPILRARLGNDAGVIGAAFLGL